MKPAKWVGRNCGQLVVAGALGLAGCHASQTGAPARQAPVPQPMTPPAAGGAAPATCNAAGIAFQYPSSWKQAKGDTSVLLVIAPKPAAGGGFASLFLDVPDVPSFEAALASPKAVADGYVKDAKKKRIPDARVVSTDITVAGSAAQDVTMSGKETGSAPGLPPAGSDATEEAVAVVHGGKIYIFSCDSDPAGTPAAHAALMSAIQSAKWTR